MKVLAALALCGIAASPVAAQQFMLQTGPPAAAMPDPLSPGVQKKKDVLFVVRSRDCADVSAFQLSATAEGLVNGARQSVALEPAKMPQPGVFAFFKHWPEGGAWVVSVSGTCGTQAAGATVRMTGAAYHRDHVELLPHHPTRADIERALAGAAAVRW
jgi:hypothetical protein